MHRQVAVPGGDVVIHSGDFCRSRNSIDEVKDFARWIGGLPHKHKIVTAGNHDGAVEKSTKECRKIFEREGVTLLLNEEVVIEGVKFWGSPTTPTFLNWYFMKDRGAPIREVWEQIPEDVDVLITHGPPYGHGSMAPPYRTPHPKEAGCLDLLNRIREIQEATSGRYPRVHCCGHIHCGYGVTASDQFASVTFINASVCTEAYRPTNSPVRFEIGIRTDG